MLTKRRCSKCARTFPLNMFKKSLNNLGGISDICKACASLLTLDQWEAKKTLAKQKTAKWKSINNAKVKEYNRSAATRFRVGKYAAKRRNYVWEIDFDVYKKMLLQPCHYCGENILNEGGASLDRKNNTVGYIIENVVVCCGDCNTLKGATLTYEEMRVVIKALMEYRANN